MVGRGRDADRQLAGGDIAKFVAVDVSARNRVADDRCDIDPVVKVKDADPRVDLARCGRDLVERNDVGGQAISDGNPQIERMVSRTEPHGYAACGRNAAAPRLVISFGRAMLLAVECLDGEAAGDGGGDRQRASGLFAVVLTGGCQRGVGSDPQSQGIAGNQRLDRPRDRLILLFGSAVERRIGTVNAGLRCPDHRQPDRQQGKRQEQKQLGCRRQPMKPRTH